MKGHLVTCVIVGANGYMASGSVKYTNNLDHCNIPKEKERVILLEICITVIPILQKILTSVESYCHLAVNNRKYRLFFDKVRKFAKCHYTSSNNDSLSVHGPQNRCFFSYVNFKNVAIRLFSPRLFMWCMCQCSCSHAWK